MAEVIHMTRTSDGKYVVCGTVLDKDEVKDLKDTVASPGWKGIDRIFTQAVCDIVNNTLGGAAPLKYEEYVFAHGQYAQCMKIADITQETQAIDLTKPMLE